jgi:hypothetical protein
MQRTFEPRFGNVRTPRAPSGSWYTLAQGSCVATGTAFDIPMVIQVEALNLARRPANEDVDLRALWVGPTKGTSVNRPVVFRIAPAVNMEHAERFAHPKTGNHTALLLARKYACRNRFRQWRLVSLDSAPQRTGLPKSVQSDAG